MSGFVKIMRSVYGTWVHGKDHYFRAWGDILAHVNYEEKQINVGGQHLICREGQAVYSLDSWVEIFNSNKSKGCYKWNKNKVRHFLKSLKSDGYIDLEGMKNTTILTLKKTHDFHTISTHQNTHQNTRTTTEESVGYEGSPHTKTHTKTHDSHTISTPTKERRIKNTSLKEKDKKEKPVKSKQDAGPKKVARKKGNVWDGVEVPPEFDDEIFDAFLEFMDYKKQKRQSYKSPRSIKSLFKEWAQAIRDHGKQNLILSIEQTFANNWSGVFPKNHTTDAQQRFNNTGQQSSSVTADLLNEFSSDYYQLDSEIDGGQH